MSFIVKPIFVNTGEQERVSKTLDDFFYETRLFIEREYVVYNSGFERVQRIVL